MKKIFLDLTIILFLLQSCSKDDVIPTEGDLENTQAQSEKPLSKTEIDKIIMKSLKMKRDFHWKDVSDHVLWSALQYGENVLTIGYGNGIDDFENKSTVYQKKVKKDIIDQVIAIENKNNLGVKQDSKLLLNEERDLTFLDMRVRAMETIITLRKNPKVRYIEPIGYNFSFQTKQAAKSPGCGREIQNLNPNDYKEFFQTINGINKSIGKIPWNFYSYHKIDKAWTEGNTAGKDVTVGIIDTGTSTQQYLLNDGFENDLSFRRFITKYGIFADSWWPSSTDYDGYNDRCGHGTSMASVIGAPFNDMGNRAPIGVAPRCNLVTYRAAGDVFLDDSFQGRRGVAKAFNRLADRSDVKIISLSMGGVISWGNIEDAVKRATRKGKLIFCAAGTSTDLLADAGAQNIVIFPARMRQTVAVTGLEEGAVYEECDKCHYGSEVMFSVLMERNSDRTVPVLSYYNAKTDYVGGSSVATAMMAGVAALVWSKDLSQNREQVLRAMKRGSHLYPNKDSRYGYGMINALRAVNFVE